jgi:hypothetical protein
MPYFGISHRLKPTLTIAIITLLVKIKPGRFIPRMTALPALVKPEIATGKQIIWKRIIAGR